MLSNDLGKDSVDLTGHVCRITADIKVSLLLQEFVDLLSTLFKPVLDVDLLRALTREGGDELKLVA